MSGDTWGISGPVFVITYLVVALLAAFGAGYSRVRSLDRRATDARELGAQQAAYLNGGPRLAIYASLGWLGGAGAIEVVSDRLLSASGALPDGSTPLDEAIHHLARTPVAARDLRADPRVAAALDELRTDLWRRGLLVHPGSRQLADGLRLLLWVVLAVGVARLFSGIANDKPVLYLAIALLVPVVALIATGRMPDRTTAGTVALGRLRDRHPHLSPTHAPAYATYGAYGAALSIALFGSASLWAMDPAFAAEARIPRDVGGAGLGTDHSYAAGDGGSAAGSSGGGGGSGCGG